MIDAYPRSGELLARREARQSFSAGDLRDLQVWHKLAWVDPFYLAGDDRVRALVARGAASPRQTRPSSAGSSSSC